MKTTVEATETCVVLRDTGEPSIAIKNVDMCGLQQSVTLVLELSVDVDPQALAPLLQALGRINHWGALLAGHGAEGDEDSSDYSWALTLERGARRDQGAPPPPADTAEARAP